MHNQINYWMEKLKKFKESDVLGLSSWRSHAWKRAETRNIGNETIKWNLTNPDELIGVESSKKFDGGKDLYFKLSNKRILFVAILIKKMKGREKLIVKTSYIIYRKVQKNVGDSRWK